MVAFCMKCGASLPPNADIVIRGGKEMPSPYYQCSSCGQMAGEPKAASGKSQSVSEKTESGKTQ